MLLAAIAAVSAGVLGYQVVLARLLAIVQWHHFAAMIVSLALLGYGASGTALTLARARLAARWPEAFALCAALFGASAVGAFALGQRVAFNPLAVIWDPAQLGYLLVLYALFTVPFFFAASCAGLAFAFQTERVGRLYRADLVGAGLGALAVLALLWLVPPPAALTVVGASGFAGAALASLHPPGRRRPGRAAAFLLAGLALAFGVPESWTALRLSEYKGLSAALLLPGARIVDQRSGPLGYVSVVESPLAPFRHAPGLSLANTIEPPAQLALFSDGEGMSAITAFDGDLARLAYLDFTTAALPYHLIETPRVLVLGPGGGADVLRALYHRASTVDAVELDPHVVDVVRRVHAGFAGRLYDRPGVAVHTAEARAFVRAAGPSYDLIELPLFDSLGVAATGALGLSESYVYTVEAFEDYLRRLRPGGLVSITRWLQLPPRDLLKLVATALAALERRGAADPARHLAVIRGWSTATLLVKDRPLSAADEAAIRRFAEARGFDLGYLPGLAAGESNRFNLLAADELFEGARALAGPGRADFLARYKFDIAPASDDRPYFFDAFRWRALPELLALRAQGGAALLGWGYLILAATLAQAVLLGGGLILLPLALARREAARASGRARVAGYFLAIGLAFLFVEIASIQRFTLFLGHPLYALAVVIAGFLVFAGLGAGAAGRLAARVEAGTGGRVPPIAAAAVAVAALALLHAFALPKLLAALLAAPEAGRIALALALIAPLAFFMGMPFPLALKAVGARAPALVPWSWGVNGCASVVSAVLAQLLAMSLGFAAVLALAAGLYLAAAALAPRVSPGPAAPRAAA